MTSPNAHANHPERVIVQCPWPKCGKTHLPHTQVAREHRAKALRTIGRRDNDEMTTKVLWLQVVHAPTLRAARKAAADAWRSANQELSRA